MNRLLGLVCGLAMATAGCSGGGTSSTPPTTTPTPFPVTTEMFTGTVSVGGTDSKNFTVALNNGQLTVTLTAAGPPASIFMGVGVGMPSAGTCSVLTNNAVATQAGTTAQLVFTGVSAGAYCVSVFDLGNQSADVNYAVTLTHY